MRRSLTKLIPSARVAPSQPQFSRLIHVRLGALRSQHDPFQLPLSSAPSSQNDSDAMHQDMLPQPIVRYGEDLDTLRARLVYQSRKRGTLESDLLLSTFAKENLANMDEQELKEFDKLMDEPDWDIYYWAIEKRQPPERWTNSSLLEKLKVHARNEGKVVRMMPELPRFTSEP